MSSEWRDLRLSAARQQELERDFAKVDKEKIGTDQIGEHLQQLGELKGIYV